MRVTAPAVAGGDGRLQYVTPGRPPATPEPAVRVARQIMEIFFGPVASRGFAVRFWDSGIRDAGPGAPAFTLVLRDRSALRRMFLPPSQLRIAEAFVGGAFDVEGDLETAAGLGETLSRRLASPRALARAIRLLGRLPRGEAGSESGGRRSFRRRGRRHTPGRDAGAIRSHYDVGNAFYSLWLDPAMVYSCGYFERADESLADAQRGKLDLICRKLRLQPGERLLDIGCGWGGLIRHAAREYGVTAVGITLSPAQAEWARDRIRKDGLGDRCSVELRDYRALDGLPPFDRIASVGMCEHVGRRAMPEYFRAAWNALRPGGLFLNHCIVVGARPTAGGRLARMLWREGAFTERYVFPDGELPVFPRLLHVAERQGFELRDVESLREHYATTLRHWVRRLEAAREEGTALTGPATWRVWRLYMAASAHGFTTGRLGLVQALLAKPDGAGRVPLPRTRDDIYATRERRTAAGASPGQR